MDVDYIDEDLYSRQLCVVGHSAMRAIASAHVLLVGLNGLGVEIAKNIILGGLKSVTLLDEEVTTLRDLGCQYYLSEEDVGRPRAAACLSQLSELNDYVSVTLPPSTGGDAPNVCGIQGLTEHLILGHQLVILADQTMTDSLLVGDICHNNGIMLLTASTFGLCGSIFCDLGEEFQVEDIDGNDEKISKIQFITKEENAKIVCCSETPHNLFDTMVVTVDSVEGMDELNGKSFTVEVIDRFVFSIDCDTSSYPEYRRGGVVILGKQKETYQFKSLRDSISARELVKSSTDKMDSQWSLHSCFVAADKFRGKFQRLPTPNDCPTFIQLVCSELQISASSQSFERVAKLFCQTCRGNLAPVKSVIGGFAAQEAMKAISSQFRPLKQFFYLDFFECLPESVYNLTETLSPLDESEQPFNRYSEQILIFGNDFQHKLENAKIFVAGAGAIGCELLKNLSLMGVCCGAEGRLTLTDMDIIEKSNLNRQFLFRNSDVKMLKSVVAARSVQQFNPKINIICHENKIGPDSEGIYNDQFYESLDCVVTALDNVPARQYLSDQSLIYRKTMIDSGTLGTQCSLQCVLPDLTRQYSPPSETDDHIPVCTLKHFPYEIVHTIHWARNKFSELFEEASNLARNYFHDKSGWMSQINKQPHYDRLFKFTTLVDIITTRPDNYLDCLRWARTRFEEYFRSDVSHILQYYPPDKVTSSGAPFWCGVKTCPHILQFDSNEELHLNFVMAAANLRATLFSIEPIRDRSEVVKLMADIDPITSGADHLNLPVPENEEEEEKLRENVSEDTLKHIEELEKKLQGVDLKENPICQPIEFEKDDDTNFHLDFITAASNLRALNYDIAPADRLKTKQVAGRIMPAIATTTSYVAGLVCLQFYKLIQGHHRSIYFRDQFTNLAVPFVAMNIPSSPSKMEYNVSGSIKSYTIWDHFDFKGDAVICDFIQHIKDDYGLEITMLSQKDKVLYALYWGEARKKSILNKSICCVLEELHGRPPVKSCLLELLCVDSLSGELDMSAPTVRLHLTQS